MGTYSSILAWRIPWTEEAGRLQSMGLHVFISFQKCMHLIYIFILIGKGCLQHFLIVFLFSVITVYYLFLPLFFKINLASFIIFFKGPICGFDLFNLIFFFPCFVDFALYNLSFCLSFCSNFLNWKLSLLIFSLSLLHCTIFGLSCFIISWC